MQEAKRRQLASIDASRTSSVGLGYVGMKFTTPPPSPKRFRYILCPSTHCLICSAYRCLSSIFSGPLDLVKEATVLLFFIHRDRFHNLEQHNLNVTVRNTLRCVFERSCDHSARVSTICLPESSHMTRSPRPSPLCICILQEIKYGGGNSLGTRLLYTLCSLQDCRYSLINS